MYIFGGLGSSVMKRKLILVSRLVGWGLLQALFLRILIYGLILRIRNWRTIRLPPGRWLSGEVNPFSGDGEKHEVRKNKRMRDQKQPFREGDMKVTDDLLTSLALYVTTFSSFWKPQKLRFISTLRPLPATTTTTTHMGGICSENREKKERREAEAKDRSLGGQSKVKHILYSYKYRFPIDDADEVVSIPIVNFHTRLTYQELALIIHQERPKMNKYVVFLMAEALTGGKSAKDPDAR